MDILPIHMLHGLKTALAAVLAYAITCIFHLEFGYWAVISTVIVMQVYVADSLEMCLYRFSGTAVGALIGAVVILVTPKNEFYIGAALFVTIAVCSFLTQYKTRYRMAAITVVIIVMTGIHTDNIFIFSLARVLEIFIGILCAFLISIIVFPRKRVDHLLEKLVRQSEQCAESCTILLDAFISRQEHVDETLVDELVHDVRGNHILLDKIHHHEALIYQKESKNNFSEKVWLMNRCTEHLRNMVNILNSLDGDGYEIIMAQELKHLADVSSNMLILLMKNQPLSELSDLGRMIFIVEERLMTIRKEGLIRRFDLKRMVQILSFYNALKYFALDIHAGACEQAKSTLTATIKPV